MSPSLKYWDGAAWQVLYGAAPTVTYPGTELDYKQITADVSITGTSEATAQNVIVGNAVTYDGTRVKVEAWIPLTVPGGGSFYGLLYRDATLIGQFVMGDAAATARSMAYGVGFDTPSAGSHTYSMKAWTASGTSVVRLTPGTNANFAPAFLRVTKA